jgi:hypothetical protein
VKPHGIGNPENDSLVAELTRNFNFEDLFLSMNQKAGMKEDEIVRVSAAGVHNTVALRRNSRLSIRRRKHGLLLA